MADAKFTLFVPSYNGGAYLKECIAALRAQDYPHFKIAILDDGSTDGSLEWLKSLSEPRLTVYPAPEHLGIVENWARAKDIPKAEWMTIVGQDDLLHPSYLTVMDALTKKHPDAGLYHAHFRFVDACGKTLRPCRPLPARETAAEYLAALFSGQRDTYGTGYLMRSAHYDAAGGIPEFDTLLFADDALWMTLMLQRSASGGGKVTAADECFSCRLHRKSASGGTSWQFWLRALPPYAALLCRLAAADADFAAALTRHGPAYFQFWQRQLYVLALTRATLQRRRVEPDALAAIAALPASLPPGLHLPPGRGFAAGRGIRAREQINRFAATRTLYCAYVRLRYGEKSWNNHANRH